MRQLEDPTPALFLAVLLDSPTDSVLGRLSDDSQGYALCGGPASMESVPDQH